MGHSFDILTFDFLLKLPQPFTGLFFGIITHLHPSGMSPCLIRKESI